MKWKVVKIIGVILGIVASVATVLMLLYELLGINVFTYIPIVMKSCIPLWIISLISIIIIVMIAVLKLSGISHYKKRDCCKAVFADYNEDIFQDLLFRWDYVQINNRYAIGHIWILCRKCKCQIINDQCQICGAVFIDVMDRQRAEAMIQYSIEKKYGSSAIRDLEINSNV